MTPLQKVIKYGAIAFGFYLVFVILSAIIFGIATIFGVFFGIDAYKSYTTKEEVIIESFEETFESANNLDIKLNVSKLTIKTGDEFRVEVRNSTDDFYCKMDGDTLKIRDKRSNVNLFNFSNNDVMPEIILYITQNQKISNIEIETGINETYIEKIVADKIDIETGVGKFVINSEILQEAKIHAGVGQLIVNLEGNKESYKVKASTGLGSLLVDGKKAEDNQIIGDGSSYIKVEAGVGEVQINFLEKNS